MSSRPSSSNSPSRHPTAHVTFASQVLRPAPLSASINHSDPLLSIGRAAAGLQKTIQIFLDAQAEALLAGVGAEDIEQSAATSPVTTSTPSLSSGPRHDSASVMPVRQPPKQKISLRRARRGLTRSMQEFAALKEEERNIVEAETHKRNLALETLASFTTKRANLEQGISQIRDEDTSQRANRLRSEAHRVEVEIHDLEIKLYELRAKHHYMITEAKQLENSVSSKLSSYQASLKMVERDMERFLARPPIMEPLPPSVTEEGFKEFDRDGAPFYTLHAKRRTVAMAEETWREETTVLSEKAASVRREQQALLKGSGVWSSVVDEVQALEKDISEQMKQQRGDPGPPVKTENVIDLDGAADRPIQDQDEGNVGMDGIISQMDKTITSLASKLHQAEDEGWNLLICCIGAELEALRQGRRMLSEALGIIVPSDFSDTQVMDHDGEHHSSVDGDAGGQYDQNTEPLISRTDRLDDGAADLLEQTGSNGGRGERDDNSPPFRQTPLAECEDDEPHPDLLVSQE